MRTHVLKLCFQASGQVVMSRLYNRQIVGQSGKKITNINERERKKGEKHKNIKTQQLARATERSARGEM